LLGHGPSLSDHFVLPLPLIAVSWCQRKAEAARNIKVFQGLNSISSAIGSQQKIIYHPFSSEDVLAKYIKQAQNTWNSEIPV
jgi:hypothetical protein